MAQHVNGIERVPEFLRGAVSEYADLVRQLGGDNTRALTLFGAVVADAFDPQRHTVTNVLTLGEVDLDLLRRLAEHGARLGKHQISAPLIMTTGYIRQSLDTFPLELLEIQQQHVTLFGDDDFADLSFDDTHVRLQCERELKVTLIGLRQGLLAAAGREKVLDALESEVAANLLRTLRGMLWLKGQKQAQPAPAVLDAMEPLADGPLTGLRAALDPSADRGWPTFQKLHDDVAALGALVDAW